LIFPLCSGGELYEAIVRRGGHFTELDAACVMRNLIGALCALHDHNVLHLDIKPENILFTVDGPDGVMQLTDFGLSKMNGCDTGEGVPEVNFLPSVEQLRRKLQRFKDYGQMNTSNLRGTVGYMSPEIILTGIYTKAADIFAAGVILYILLSGNPPFASKSNRYEVYSVAY
jgi:serine/threonine protein kinase